MIKYDDRQLKMNLRLLLEKLFFSKQNFEKWNEQSNQSEIGLSPTPFDKVFLL